jgi:hypothetical protein
LVFDVTRVEFGPDSNSFATIKYPIGSFIVAKQNAKKYGTEELISPRPDPLWNLWCGELLMLVSSDAARRFAYFTPQNRLG